MTDVDPTAVVELGATLGDGVIVRRLAHVREGAHVGDDTRIGAGAYIGAGVTVGAGCKVHNLVQLFEGTTVGDGVFMGPGTVVTNDRHPRAVTPDGRVKGDEDWAMAGVTIADGASIGARAVLIAGVTLGEWCVVAAGAVVTRDVRAYELVAGVPARHAGWVCRCGTRIEPDTTCPTCHTPGPLR